MKSNCLFERKPDYLLATITGIYNKNEFKMYPKVILDECQKEKVYRVLVNALKVAETNLSVLDRFILGEEMAKVTGGKLKIAIAWPEKDITKFGETVAVNRGAFVCVFSNIPDAEIWLADMNV